MTAFFETAAWFFVFGMLAREYLTGNVR